MPKIAIIGAGSVSFTRFLLCAFFYYKNVKDSEFYLHDVKIEKLYLMQEFANKLKKSTHSNAEIKITNNLSEALENANFVITTFSVGGIDIWSKDIEIPKKYKVFQEVGDTMGVGGLFRGLRHMPVLIEIAQNMQKLCPKAILFNEANPLAPLIWAVSEVSDIQIYGDCYGIHYSLAQLLGFLSLSKYIKHPIKNQYRKDIVFSKLPDNLELKYAGINHMTWFLEIKLNKTDLYPQIKKLCFDEKVLQEDFIRFEILKKFGYFSTINHWHMSDYLPYFKKNTNDIKRYLSKSWNIIELEKEKISKTISEIQGYINDEIPIPLGENIFNIPKVINALINDENISVNLNVKNKNYITNLPSDCVVEIPCIVKNKTIKPQNIGKLPHQCAALNLTNINFQRLLVQSVLQKDLNLARQALYLDPLTSSVCSLDEMDQIFDEMLKENEKYLNYFFK